MLRKKKQQSLKIARKDQVWDFIRRGELLFVDYDLETSGLKGMFVQITGYGDAVADLAGNFISKSRVKIKRPERMVYSGYSYAVTGTSPKDHDDPSRLPHRVGMGMIVERIEHMSRQILNLPLPRQKISFDTVRKKGGVSKKSHHTERVVEYPLLDEKGQRVVHVRYHPDRDMIAYRFEDNPKSPYYESVENDYYIDGRDQSKWRFVAPRVEFDGYRNTYADNKWIRPNLITAGYHPVNTFLLQARATPSNKQRPKNYTADVYHLAMMTHLLGPQGEGGLKMGTRTDARDGATVPSARLGDVMGANTRHRNTQRGIEEGVFMISDGSVFDPNKAHDETYDAEASLSLKLHCFKLAPDVFRAWKLQSDENELKRMLTGYKDQLLEYSPPPVFVMVRNTWPYAPVADPVVFIGFDDRIGKLRKALAINIADDLASYTYNGKALTAMSPDDFVAMIRDQARRPDPLVRIEPIRKWKGAYPLELAYNYPGRRHWDPARIDDNCHFLLKNPGVCDAIRQACEIINWGAKRHPEIANPMMEEQAVFNNFGDLDYIEAKADNEQFNRSHGRLLPEKGMARGIAETIHAKATAIYQYHNSMDEMLHRIALQPHPLEWSDDPRHLENDINLLERIRAKFRSKKSPYLSVFDSLIPGGSKVSLKKITLDRARQFRWDFMQQTLRDDEAERQRPGSGYAKGLFDYHYTQHGRVLYANLSRDFRIVDAGGREMTADYVIQHHQEHPDFVLKKFESGEWRIQFYRLSSEPSITATLYQFADMKRLQDLDLTSRFKYEVLKDLRLCGPANEEPSRHRWDTISSLSLDAERLNANAQVGAVELAKVFSTVAIGEGDNFLSRDEGQRLAGELLPHVAALRRERASHPLRGVFGRFQNVDPDTGIPLDRIANEIAAENTITVTVPDPHLRNPINDIRYSPYSLVVPVLPEGHVEKIRKGAVLLLRGRETGRVYYPGPVTVKKAPAENGSFKDYYDQARAAYRDGGEVLPSPEKCQTLVVQALQPVANTRRTIDPTIQTVKVPSLYFDGLAAPRLAHFDPKTPLTGLVLPAAYCTQKMQPGKPIRFREMDAPMGAKIEGLNETETGHIYESTLRRCRRMSMQSLYDALTQGKFKDEQAVRCGFASAFDLWEKLNQAYINNKSPNPGAEDILLLEFDPVGRKTWAYYNLLKAPEAALTYKGLPVMPSAYRQVTAANDPGPVKRSRKKAVGGPEL